MVIRLWARARSAAFSSALAMAAHSVPQATASYRGDSGLLATRPQYDVAKTEKITANLPLVLKLYIYYRTISLFPHYNAIRRLAARIVKNQ